MGDGVQKKYALIVNGDDELRHLGNVDQAVSALRREGPYTIAVASSLAPKDPQAVFANADEAGLEKLIPTLTLP